MSPRVIVLVAGVAIACTAYARQPDPIYRETIVRHARPREVDEKFDAQESDPKLGAAFAAADAAAERRVGNVKRDDYFVFHFWAEKKKILLQRYGIAWSSPAELNPRIAYDSYGQRRITQHETREITPIVRKRTSRAITSIDRDFDGKVTVWTKANAHHESLAYVVRLERGRWRIVDVETWMP
jgi:hypothetical protein